MRLYTSPMIESENDTIVVPEEAKVVIPSFVIEAAIRKGASKRKKGKVISAGVFVEEDPVVTGFRKSIQELWESGEYMLRSKVTVQRSAVMRTRPIFRDWGLTVPVQFDPSMIDKEELHMHIKTAGAECGLGDWRPRYGRFTIQEV
jgi:hypothetical protein